MSFGCHFDVNLRLQLYEPWSSNVTLTCIILMSFWYGNATNSPFTVTKDNSDVILPLNWLAPKFLMHPKESFQLSIVHLYCKIFLPLKIEGICASSYQTAFKSSICIYCHMPSLTLILDFPLS